VGRECSDKQTCLLTWAETGTRIKEPCFFWGLYKNML
jgi:hypothetical protein